MLLTNYIKCFFASILCVVVFSSCGWRAAKSQNAPSTPFAAEQSKSGVPFSTKEPENFQAEFVITTGDNFENKIFAARAGNRRRYDYKLDKKNRFAVLQTNESENFLIFPNKKLYAQNSNSGAGVAQQQTENFQDFLTNEWLNNVPEAEFERLGTENGLTKYTVRLNDSDAAETIVFVDERINLPVRQEFYSRRGDGQKVLTYAVEMRNFKSQTDENLFEIPKDYRKVSPEDLKTAMQKEGFSEE